MIGLIILVGKTKRTFEADGNYLNMRPYVNGEFNEGGVMQIRPELSMRIMAEAENEDAVAQLVSVIQAGLASHAVIDKWSCERYWKIPEYFEVQFRLWPAGESEAAYHGITSMLSVWDHSGEEAPYADQEALWNRAIDPGSNFLDTAINWVQIFLEFRAILPAPPKFRVGERVRWTGTSEPDEVALAGKAAIVNNIWPSLEGHYDYSASFEHLTDDMPLLWAREDELEAASL